MLARLILVVALSIGAFVVAAKADDPQPSPVPSSATIHAPGGWTFIVMDWPAAPAPSYASVSTPGPNPLFTLYWPTQACGLVGYAWTSNLNLHVEPGRCDTWGAIAALESERGLVQPRPVLIQAGSQPVEPIVFFDTSGRPLPMPATWPPPI